MPHIETLRELISWLTPLTGLVDFYIEESKKLEKKDSRFIIADMDDTLISREQLTIQEPLLKVSRGQEGNKVVINHFGIHDIVERFYANQNPPQDIADVMRASTDSLVLTAWVPEYAMMKYKAAGLTQFPIEVVYDGKDKILKTLQYIIFTLKYIPSEIVIYEDRPQYFVEYRDLIEWLLKTKLTIMYVEMDGNNWYQKIEKV
jgi:hypothetical protein